MADTKSTSLFNKVSRWLIFGVLLFVGLSLVLSLLIQLPIVQNWAVNQISKRVSNDVGTYVGIDHVKLNFFDDLVVDDLLIMDEAGDTLLYSEYAYFDLDQPLWGLIKNRISFQAIELQSGLFQLKTDASGTANYQFLLDYLLESRKDAISDSTDLKDEGNGLAVIFDPTEIRVDDIHFTHENHRNGKYTELWIPQAAADLEKVNPEDPLRFKEISITDPSVTLRKYPREILEQVSEVPTTLPSKTKTAEKSTLVIDQLHIHGGKVRLEDDRGRDPLMSDDIIDFANLEVSEIDADLTDLKWFGNEGTLGRTTISLRTREGFTIESLSADSIQLDSSELQLHGYTLKTPNTEIGNDLVLEFSNLQDFKSFEDAVRIQGSFNNSYLGVQDILYFSGKLNQNEFFQLNGGEQIFVSGRVNGPLNNLQADNLRLNIGNKATVSGNLHIQDLLHPGEELVDLQVTAAKVDIVTLRQLIPNFNLPENYNKLGAMEFTGTFDGYFNDFDATGFLSTELGDLNMDMNFGTEDGDVKNADYRGKIELIDFDLEKWMDSDLYGLASFSAEVTEGKSLDINNASANLYAKLDYFYYRGYHYRNAILEGELNKSFFDGQFYIEDPNASLDFSGDIDFSDSIPKVDFAASIGRIDFQKLNISPRPLIVSGDVDFNFEFHDLYNLDGSAHAFDLTIIDDTTVHRVDSMHLYSNLNNGNRKVLRLESDIMDIFLQGHYDLETLPGTVTYLMEKKHPAFTNQFGIIAKDLDTLIQQNDFVFEATLKESRGIQKLINRDLGDFNEVTLNGFFRNRDTTRFEYHIDLIAPTLSFGKNTLSDLVLQLQGAEAQSIWNISTSKFQSGNKVVEPLDFSGILVSDSLTFDLRSESVINTIKDLKFGGQLYLTDSLFQIDLAASSFELLDEPWSIVPGNYVQLGEKFIKTEKLTFLSEHSALRVISPGDNSLQIETENVDISFLDDFDKKEEVKFKGSANTAFRIENIFQDSPMQFDLQVDSFRVNDDDYGIIRSIAYLESLDSTGNIEFGILDDDKSVTIDGTFFIPRNNTSDEAADFTFDLTVEDYPIHIIEYFIEDISNTTGTWDAKFVIENNEGKPAPSGELVMDGQMKIDYLGTTYRMDTQTILITPTLFDFDGAEIIDELGNSATIVGGITHDHFANLGMEAIVASNNFMWLNTTKEDNDIYYGTGIGDASIQFSGDFLRANMRIRATTGPNTQLNIPLEDNYSSTGDAFIQYVFEDDFASRQGLVDLRGINLDMQLNITPDAEVQLIFDEFSGDIIRGTGNGNLTLTKERTNDLQMTGRYVIDQGEYLYTLLDFINKPFSIDRGGLITWTGDPLAANLDIQTRYTGLKVPPRNLIAEYLEGAGQVNDEIADISTQVDLILKLQGVLSQPEINFDIQFPEIDPSIKNITEGKMRVLKEDVSELNRQVYGLLILNSFLPPSINLDLTTTTVNTLSEFITSQLSNYVAAYVTQGVEEVDYISGVDFYFDYNYYRSEDFIQGQQTGVKTGSEFALAPNIRFFDDRLAFSPGASVIEGTVLQGSAFIGTDVKLDYFMTPDKRLRLSLFYKRFPSLGGSRNKLGLGVRWYKSYDSIGDIFRKKKSKPEIPTPEPEPDSTEKVISLQFQ